MDASIRSFFETIKQKDAVYKLIFFNAFVFIVLSFVSVIEKLFALSLFDPNPYLAVSSDGSHLLFHLWTVFTYMFVHYDVLHIAINMLLLYWFGKIFLLYFTDKNFVALYLVGGFAGAVIFLLGFNYIPYFVLQGKTFLVGASASVTAIIFAAAFYNTSLQIRLFFLGSIKIVYIAIGIFLIDFISLGGERNMGGHLSHIGGAIIGYTFAAQYRRGRDITAGLNKMIDFLVNAFKRKPKMTVKYMNARPHFEDKKRKQSADVDIDTILDKIKISGYKSLTDEEKKRLFDASNK